MVCHRKRTMPFAFISTILIFACQSEETALPETLVTETTTPIINGSEDFTGKAYLQYRTVRVRRYPVGARCSGVLVLPNVVLTARHCITDDGSIRGALPEEPEAVRVRIDGDPWPPTSTDDSCTGSARIETCAVASKTYVSDDLSVDVVMLELEEPVRHENLQVPFSPLPSGVDENAFVDTEKMVSGWGTSSCDDNSYALRWGDALVSGVDYSQNYDEVLRHHLITYKPGSTGQNFFLGDSGGPTWSDELPHAVIGIHSIGECIMDLSYTRDVSLVHPYHFDLLYEWMNSLEVYEVNRDLSSLDQVELVYTEGNPVWTILNNHLVQTANEPRSFALLADVAFHGIVDQKFSVTVNGPDDDGAGIVFNYLDNDNYLFCAANEQISTISLIAQYQGELTVLGTAPWYGDFSQDVIFAVTSFVNGNNEIDYTCMVSGGGADGQNVTGQFSLLGAGRAGVFNNYNMNLSYRDFSVDRIFDDCNEGTAIDMGDPGTSIVAPNNGCLKITDYPIWWGTRQMLLQNTAPGSYPVPFEWANPCGGSYGEDTILNDWQSFNINNISDECATLIDLKGAGDGNITIRYYSQ